MLPKGAIAVLPDICTPAITNLVTEDDRPHPTIALRHFSRICHSVIVVLPAPSDRLADLKPLVPEFLAIHAIETRC